MAYSKKATSDNKSVGKPRKAKSPTKPSQELTTKTTRPKIDDAVILALSEIGKPSREIQELTGIGYRTVCRRLKHLTPRKTTEMYKHYRADIFAEKQRQLLMSSHTADAKTQRDIATCVGIYFDKERLERGQSTSNQSVQMGLSEGLQLSVDKIVARSIPITVDRPVDNSTCQPSPKLSTAQVVDITHS